MAPRADGTTPWIALPPPPPGEATLLLHVAASPDRCLGILGLRDDQGEWVGAPRERDDLGPYCVSCAQRVSVLHDSGLYVLPSGAAPRRPEGTLQLRLRARDCLTLLSAEATPGERWRLEAAWAPAPPAASRGTLALDFFLARGTALGEDPAPRAALGALLDLINEELLPGGLEVALRDVRRIDAPDPLAFATDDPGPLDRLASGARAPGAVPVFLLGCLVERDPLLRSERQPEGYVQRVPGGLGGEGGVFLRGRPCAAGAPPIDWSPQLLARLLLHELGHHLGLYHSVEEDGRADQLDDTGEQNLMYFRPLLASARGLSETQLLVLRRHPLWRWGGHPRGIL